MSVPTSTAIAHSGPQHFLVCTIGESKIGLPVACIDRVTASTSIVRIEPSPGTLLGLIDYHGTIAPVLSARRRIGYEQPPVGLSDKFVIAHCAQRICAVCVDEIGLISSIDPDRITPMDAVSERDLRLFGVAQLADGLIVILDMERFLTAADESELAAAMERLNGN